MREAELIEQIIKKATRATLGLIAAASLSGVVAASAGAQPGPEYYDNTGRDDVLAGGVKMIPVETPAGTFRVWTKRTGNNPRMKLLLLHGGPGSTHEYFEAFDSFMPAAGVEYYYYDQLGSKRSDQPEDDRLWTIPRFVEEVEQVRKALGMNADNFYLLGNSWGGLLAMEYALKYQQNLKGLVISNMMASLPAYDRYADEVLAKRLDPDALAEIRALEAAGDFENPRYEELLLREHYTKHVLRMPIEDWPEPVLRAFGNTNRHIYVLMQGPSEFGVGGTLADWDRTADIHKIRVPTLVTVAQWDTMDPAHMRWMVEEMPNARALDLPDGSHLSMYDDQQRYFDGLIRFMRDVDAGRF
ncbi:MAG: proline-specific peptidase family protein [Parvularculaceae bacterium]